MLAIFKRELRSCFHGMIGAVLTAFMLAATAIYFVALNLGYGLPDFAYYTLYRTIFVLLLYRFFRDMCASFCREKDWFTRLHIVAVGAGIAGFLVQAMTDYSFYNYRVMFMFWGFLGIYLLFTKLHREEAGA